MISKLQTSNVRLSNMELLRIIAMFLVLVVHADFFSLGTPTQIDVQQAPLSSFAKFFFESLSIVCVNVFILISGWFGIKPNIKSFGSFLFQCFFFLWGIYVFLLITGNAPFGIKGIAGCFFLLEWNWFIKAYIGLYILSPTLNSFVKNATKKQLEVVLVSFYAFQTIYSWGTNAALDFRAGYSIISFVGLYLLARYLRLYFKDTKWVFRRNRTNLSAYFLLVVFSAVVALIGTGYIPYGGKIAGRFYTYDSPVVILSSVFLILYFSRLTLQSKIINTIAASSFAVFLLHTNPNIVIPYFKESMIFLFDKYDSWAYLSVTFIALVAIFISAVLIDKIRIVFWKKMWTYINNNYLHNRWQ